MECDDFLMISGIKHFKYCRRRWALVHIENQWEENALTVEGHLMHEQVHDSNFKLYTLLTNEICGALESVGLDPYVGYLHQKRPGRCSLALDLLEEFRAPLADRFVLSQINLGAILPDDFEIKENGAVFLKDDARRKFLTAWQTKKQEEIRHPFFEEKIPWGMAAYAQALLFARWLRGDIDAYPPFFWK